MICTIVGAMPEKDLVLPENGFVIAADEGFARLAVLGITPDLVVGDFDSLGFVPDGVTVVRHPVRKDDTDMVLSVREGLDRGYKKFLLYGGVGGRLDHSIANLQTLSFLAARGAKGVLFGGETAVTLLENTCVHLPAKPSGNVSVFAYGGEAVGVCIRGLSYTMENGTLTTANPTAVSNSFCGTAAQIAVRQGKLLLTWQASSAEAIEFLERSDTDR